MSVEKNKIDGDPAATDGEVPVDVPARPTMEENAAFNRRYQHLPPEVALEEYKNVPRRPGSDRCAWCASP